MKDLGAIKLILSITAMLACIWVLAETATAAKRQPAPGSEVECIAIVP